MASGSDGIGGTYRNRKTPAAQKRVLRSGNWSMATANPTWGAPRVHGELKKLGFKISERTVSRLMPKKTGKPSQTWMTFLRNHVRQMVSVDFFTVQTIRLRVLYVFFILA